MLTVDKFISIDLLSHNVPVTARVERGIYDVRHGCATADDSMTCTIVCKGSGSSAVSVKPAAGYNGLSVTRMELYGVVTVTATFGVATTQGFATFERVTD